MAGEAGFGCTLTIGGVTVGKAQDVDFEMTAGEGDTTVRDSEGWKQIIHLIKEWASSIEHLWVPTNTALQALQNAFMSGADVAAVFTDANGYGFSGAAKVMSFKRGEPISGVVTASISLTGNGKVTLVTPSS